MQLGRAMQRPFESIDLPPPHARSPHVRPRSAPLGPGAALPDGCHQTRPEFLALTYAPGQTAWLSGGASSLASIAPTSRPSGRPCSRCACGTSSATLLLLAQLSVCCIDRFRRSLSLGAPNSNGGS